MLLGLLVFLLDRWFISESTSARRIVIDDTRLEELMQVFREGQGREPTPNEVTNMIVKWAQNEIMYREALQMGLDQGDEMIRNRMVLKLHNVLFNRAAPENPSEEELEVFFDLNRARYNKPPRYDFEQFYLPDIDTREAAQALADKLGHSEVPENYRQGFMQYNARPEFNLVAMFTQQDTQAMLAQEAGQWVPVKSGRGLHLARITQKHELEPVVLDDVRSRVVREWKKYQADLQLAQQTVDIANAYDISLDLSEENKALVQEAESMEERFRKTVEQAAQPISTASASR